ncbi:type ISP restriction/modification enzyme [Hansschlegelia zhihuaiae]|uniref:site-specific DNA-methyltransferase (adenine-specific) n=1 Tax=Hansschlegelia zhihuaiae TaxID=405005 RepID=A0A4Q0MP15_9HYPH|nr:type ISP restriction/modification enzyme [Hansschlegelia zhihuaiae]RXF75474.1 hypothetical protein EK403_01040 [Hansschlegelia zhihuaiae]
MAADFEAYFRALARTYREEDGTEHTDRAALEVLLKAAADDAKPGARITHEPRRDKAGAGSPDFKVTRASRIAGYVEVKQIDENLSKILKSEQIKKYRTLTDNLVLTDYLEFVWIRPDGEMIRERLAHSEDLSTRKLALKPERVEAVRMLLRGFFSAAPGRIDKGQVLAIALAKRAAMLRDFLSEELQRQIKEHREGRLLALHEVFRKQVFHDLGVGDFADAFAQMLAYGLFLARLNAGDEETVTLDNVRQHIPGSFALIRELVRFLDEMNEKPYGDIRWVIEELLSIVNGVDLAAIHEDLSFRARKAVSRKVRAEDEEEHRLFERDPFIYFYEDFLKAFNPEERRKRGVYYTPPPVVNFIIRAIDDILKDSFGIEKGLADHKQVTVLDFACGTGTFLLEVFEKIFETIGGPEAGAADLIVREHLLKNIYGFEYLMAPYTIAHLKLSQYLKDKGHPLKGGERLQVFLTNTLEPVEPQRDFMLPALSREVEAAQAVKDKPILVITGNPPYSGHSKNHGTWITTSIAEYRKGFPELSKPAQGKWLQDDYVKFIRFAQMKMDAVDEGIVGVITNHSWLDNPTFKGMRKSLLESFDRVYVLDLHGNAKKKETAPDGSKDENVFDIEQGVAISLFVKRRGLEKGVWRGDVWGKRLKKYQRSAELSVNQAIPNAIAPDVPDWLLTEQDKFSAEAYRQLVSIRAIFSPLGTPAPGFVTTHDQFAISFTPEEAQRKVGDLLATCSEAEARQLFRLCTQSQWKYEKAMQELPTVNLEKLTTHVLYRPFDTRWTIWDANVAVHRRERAMNLMLSGKNVALVTSRMTKGESFRHAQIVNQPIEAICMSPLTSNNGFIFPLWRGGIETFDTDFRAFLDARYDHHYTPEELLGYIYAVLYAPSYRSRYAEFLRLDFPRIPFPEAKAQFDALSDLGWTLVQAHLLKAAPKHEPRLGLYQGKGDHAVEAVRYSPEEHAIWINKIQRFAPVPAEVWGFHIGGYQVLDKYLKSRKGRTLSLTEIEHVGKVAETLAFTIAQMARIDAAYLAAFPAVDKAEAPLAPAS